MINTNNQENEQKCYGIISVTLKIKHFTLNNFKVIFFSKKVNDESLCQFHYLIERISIKIQHCLTVSCTKVIVVILF